jgi:hypothetical protein
MRFCRGSAVQPPYQRIEPEPVQDRRGHAVQAHQRRHRCSRRDHEPVAKLFAGLLANALQVGFDLRVVAMVVEELAAVVDRSFDRLGLPNVVGMTLLGVALALADLVQGLVDVGASAAALNAIDLVMPVVTPLSWWRLRHACAGTCRGTCRPGRDGRSHRSRQR